MGFGLRLFSFLTAAATTSFLGIACVSNLPGDFVYIIYEHISATWSLPARAVWTKINLIYITYTHTHKSARYPSATGLPLVFFSKRVSDGCVLGIYVCILYVVYNFFSCMSLLYLDERQGARVTFKSIYCVSRFYIFIMLCGWREREGTRERERETCTTQTETDGQTDRQRWKERNR